MSQKLLTPILDGARHPHYFSGRLLSARDLHDEQLAQERHHRYAGRGLGSGVVEGLEVREAGAEGGRPVVEVSAGLAFDLDGTALELGKDVRLALTRAPKEETDEALFKTCRPADPGLLLIGAGVYLLTASSATGFAEQAPAGGLAEDGRSIGCGSRYRVEGVQLDLVRVDLADLPGLAAIEEPLSEALASERFRRGALSRTRNLLAHLFFGTPARTDIAARPFAKRSTGAGQPPISVHGSADGLSALRQAGKLAPCQVPLALLYWTNLGLRFLDTWAVRRRPTAQVSSAGWPFVDGAPRRTLSEAIFLQYQDHLDWLLEMFGSGREVRAGEVFHYLPAVGLLPLASSGRPGFDVRSFFADRTVSEPYHLEGAALGHAFRLAEGIAPFALSGPPDGSTASGSRRQADGHEHEMTWLYRLRENLWDRDRQGEIEGDRAGAVLFASPHLPFLGRSRFDIRRFDTSNFG